MCAMNRCTCRHTPCFCTNPHSFQMKIVEVKKKKKKREREGEREREEMQVCRQLAISTERKTHNKYLKEEIQRERERDKKREREK